MITQTQFQTKATISAFYVILFVFLGAYSLFTKTDHTGNPVQKTVFQVSQRKS